MASSTTAAVGHVRPDAPSRPTTVGDPEGPLRVVVADRDVLALDETVAAQPVAQLIIVGGPVVVGQPGPPPKPPCLWTRRPSRYVTRYAEGLVRLFAQYGFLRLGMTTGPKMACQPSEPAPECALATLMRANPRTGGSTSFLLQANGRARSDDGPVMPPAGDARHHPGPPRTRHRRSRDRRTGAWAPRGARPGAWPPGTDVQSRP